MHRFHLKQVQILLNVKDNSVKLFRAGVVFILEENHSNKLIDHRDCFPDFVEFSFFLIRVMCDSGFFSKGNLVWRI